MFQNRHPVWHADMYKESDRDRVVSRSRVASYSELFQQYITDANVKIQYNTHYQKQLKRIWKSSSDFVHGAPKGSFNRASNSGNTNSKRMYL